MRLIERVCEENLLNPHVLASANENSRVKSDMGQIQRLSKMNLLDEDSLLKLFSSWYGIPILSEASQVVKTRPEVDQVIQEKNIIIIIGIIWKLIITKMIY